MNRPSYRVTELLGDGIGAELSAAVHRLADALPVRLEFIPVDLRVESRRARGKAIYDEAVEKMLEDSLEHAFEDMDERAFTEATIKADEMLPAVDKALGALGDKVAEGDRAAILAAAGAVRAAKEEKSFPKLKAALADLDRLTEPLAAQLIELAMGS